MREMNTVGVAVLSVACMTGAAFGEMADVKIGGEIRVRAESVNTGTSQTSPSTQGQAQYLQRTRINMDARANETTKAYISFQDSRSWGAEIAGTKADGTNSTDPTTSSGRESDGTNAGQAVDISQAYFQLDQFAGQPLSLRIGRQSMSYGDRRIVGPGEWTNNARRFDAIKLIYNMDTFSVDLWSAKLVELLNSSSDSDFNGVYATVKTIPNIICDIYLLQDKTGGNAVVSGRNVSTYGLRVNGKATDTDYSAEAALQSGNNRANVTQESSAYALKAGYTIPDAAGLRIGAEYDLASGDKSSSTDKNEAFQTLYPTNHDLYGFTDDISWSNIRAWSLNASIKPAKDLWFGAEYWDYKMTEDNGNGNGNLGTEINILAKYGLNPNVRFEAAYVMRKGGDGAAEKDYYGRALANGDTATVVYLQALVAF